MNLRSTGLAALSVAGLLFLGACGGADDGTAAAASPAPSSAEDVAVRTVDANTASVAELEAAFEAVGISSAGGWASEVDRHRSYPTDDPSFAKLRAELAQHNPAAGVVDQIVATLTL